MKSKQSHRKRNMMNKATEQLVKEQMWVETIVHCTDRHRERVRQTWMAQWIRKPISAIWFLFIVAQNWTVVEVKWTHGKKTRTPNDDDDDDVSIAVEIANNLRNFYSCLTYKKKLDLSFTNTTHYAGVLCVL